MGLQFEEITENDFMSFTPGQKPTYAKIEEALISIGGGGLEGNKYKKEALECAGWKYGKLISYGAHPETAASVFNKIRLALADTEERDILLEKLH